MLDLNQFAQEVHANAVAHGWWDKEYTDAAVLALIHAEISEALEEWRAGRPMAYHACALDLMCDGSGCSDGFDPNGECKYRDPKPEGIAVELTDVVLRILDTAAAWGINLFDEFWVEPNSAKPDYNLRKQTNDRAASFTMPELACELHRLAEELHFARQMQGNPKYMALLMSKMIGMIYAWLRANGVPYPDTLLRVKHAYNQTRPHKHGGKRI